MSTPPTDPSAFADTLRSLRVRARLTQESLADRAGMTARSVSNLERGRVRGPRPATAQALAGALSLTGAEREAFLQLAAREYWSDRDGEDAAAEPDAVEPDAAGSDAVGSAPAGGVGDAVHGPSPDVVVPPPVPPSSRQHPQSAQQPQQPQHPQHAPVPSAAVTPSGLAADRLAAETLRLWRREAADRGLTDPRPIDVRWHWRPDSPVSPAAGVAARVPGVAAGPVLPLPAPLPPGGSVVALHADLFEALPHRRLVVLGPAGCGKTGALVLLLLAACERRLALPPDSRWAMPVPVWVRAADWRPGEPLLKLVRRTVMRDHAYLAHDSYGPDPVSQLYGEGRLLVLLDGLDELHPADAADAVGELDHDTVGVPLVVSCRPDPWLARPARLPHAAVVELEAVSSEEAHAYLDDAAGPGGSGPGESGPGESGPKDSAGADLLRRPLTLALLRREVRTAGREAVQALPPEQQQVRLFEGLLRRAYPHPGQRARAVRRLRWLARTTPPHGAVHWWAVPYGLPPMLQRVVIGLGMALLWTALLLPFAPQRALLLGGVAGAVTFATYGFCNGALVLEEPGRAPEALYVAGMCPRFEVVLARFRLYGVGVSLRPFRVRVGSLNRGRMITGRLTVQGGGEPSVAGFSLRGRGGFGGIVVAVCLVGAAVVDSQAAAVAIAVISFARFWLNWSLTPTLTASSYDPRSAFRLDLWHCLVDLAGAGVTLVLVAVGTPDTGQAVLATALVAACVLGMGPSVVVWPPAVALALRGVWLLPLIGVLERDRAAGLLRRVGTAYEFRHEELRQALVAGRVKV